MADVKGSGGAAGSGDLWSEVRGLCRCGLGMPYEACCGRYISGTAKAPTAEALMRSRYTAFVIGDGDYIARTWAPEKLPAGLDVNPEGEPFTRLIVLETEGGGPFDTDGVVTFEAHYPGGSLRERSTFERRDGAWVYVDGTVN